MITCAHYYASDRVSSSLDVDYRTWCHYLTLVSDISRTPDHDVVPRCLASKSAAFQVDRLDPRHQVGTHLLDFRLYRQLRAYAKQDPPPSRVKPLPIAVLHNGREMAALHGDQISLAVSDLGYMAFFGLLRPGEYCSSSESRPFRLCDVQLFIGCQKNPPSLRATGAAFPLLVFASLRFSTV
jgi:hypothetical protein